MTATALEAKMLRELQHILEYKARPFSKEYFDTYNMMTEILDRITLRGDASVLSSS
jgi:hypothetical protein